MLNESAKFGLLTVNGSQVMTFFFTLSAADLHWPELYRLLDPNNDQHQLENSALEYRRRTKLLTDDPLIVSWFFELRLNELFQTIIPANFAKWMRIEFQHRGSSHVHGFFWLADAPGVRELDRMTEEQRNDLIAYFENYLTNCNLAYDYGVEGSSNPCKFYFGDVDTHPMYSGIQSDSRRHTTMAKQLADYKQLINTV